MKNFAANLLVLTFFFVTAIISIPNLGWAQSTTITTNAATYNGTNSLTAPASISFVVNNNNGFPIILTGVSQYCTTADNTSTWQLYYSSTSLSGPSTDVTVAPWTLIATSTGTIVTASGITPLPFAGLSFTIPAGAQYRFALRGLGPGATRYSGTAAITPNVFSGGGVDLRLGDYQIAAQNVGYSGTGVTLNGNTPRYFTGAITFEPAGPCTSPPVTGTINSTALNACPNAPFTLTLSGGTGGTGQTYQWQISPNGTTFTNIIGQTNSYLTTSQTSSNYYQVAVTCGGNTVTSAPIQINTGGLVSGTYTINNLAPASATNFQSFNAAYDYIKCGINGPVVFNVNPTSGPYTEQLAMTAIPGASPTNTVTFNGNGRTLQYLSANTALRGTIELNGTKNVTFNNLVINALGASTTEYGMGVHLWNDADSNVVNGCVINVNSASTSTNYAGVVINGGSTATTSTTSLCDENIISNNIINGGYYGITLVGTSTSPVVKNRIIKNEVNDFYIYGIYVTGSGFGLVDSNDIKRLTRTTVSTAYGIYQTGLSANTIFSRNRIHNLFAAAPTNTSAGYAIYNTGSDAFFNNENRYINNLIYGWDGAGSAYGIYNSSSDYIDYIHNTIVMDGAGGTSSTIARAFYQITAASGITLRNNNIVINRDGPAIKHGLYFATSTSTISSDTNNIFLNVPAGATAANTGYFTADRATLSDWQTASGQDVHSYTINPIFAGAATGNFLPTNAAFDNLGSPRGIPNDILNVTRSATTPDIGAYEFTPGGCTAPPTPGTTVANPSPVCSGAVANISITGNSAGTGQTYTLQEAGVVAGPYTSIGSAVAIPSFTVSPTTTKYYRVAVNCNGNIAYSTPVQLVVTLGLAGGTYTINQTAPASATNFVSFNAAALAMQCGILGPVVFNVVAGTGPYNEQMTLDSIRGASAINTITFNGNGNTMTFSSSNTDERAMIKLRSTDHVRINNLVLVPTGTYGYGIHLINNADSNVISGNTINLPDNTTSSNYVGIVINGNENTATTTSASLCDSNTIINNVINSGYYGIVLQSASGSLINNNRIVNNEIKDFYFYGIYSGYTDNLLIEGNNIHRTSRSTLSTFYGIYNTTGTTRLKVLKNQLHHPFTGLPSSTSAFYGIYLSSDGVAGEEHLIANNKFYSLDGAGAQYILYNSGSDNTNYYHNTISSDVQAVATGTTYGFYQTGAATGIGFKNNNLSITRATTTSRYGIYFVTTTTVMSANYNNYYIPGANGYIGDVGTPQTTLAGWQTSSGYDANSLALNPIFVNATTGNLTPNNPGLDNKGTPVGVVDDILGVVRSTTTPDIGAYEFSIPPCTAPPTAGTTIANPNSGICMGAQVRLTLNGNSFGAGQTYQWQYATSAAGPYTNLGPATAFPDTTITATSTLYYRAVVTCNNQTANATPALVTINPAFLAGTYTINSTIPASATNFTSFATAVAALDCGITGHVYFDVAPNTYNEQIRMHAIPGSGPNARVVFRSATGVPASVTLTTAGTTAIPYTLMLDSTSNVTFKNMTILGTGTNAGQVVSLRATASYDSIINCVITAPIVTSTTDPAAGIIGTALTGSNNVFEGNTITGGVQGIALTGTSLAANNVVGNNTISNYYYYGIYISNAEKLQVDSNIITHTAPKNATAYGMYFNNSDSAYLVKANNINISATTGTTYGMYFTGSASSANNRGIIANNNIIGVNNNTGTMYGLYQSASIYNNTVNNVISVNSSATVCVGSYLTGGNGVNFHNNTILNGSTGSSTTSTNTAAYFAQSSGLPAVNVRNNIFSHYGGGRAMYVSNLGFIYSDYNTFWSSGGTLLQGATVNYPTLQSWIAAAFWDVSSIAVEPKLVSVTDPRPMLTNPDVWAIHGRGVQIPGNDYDHENQLRPTTLTTGVPDMGAYEFLPTVAPTVLTPVPATPVAGGTQVFMYATDTVAKITWKTGAPVPASITMQRYSGVLPTGLSAGQNSMYFYTKATVPAQGAYDYKIDQFYVDSWLGFIPTEPRTQLGVTNAAGTWAVRPNSTVFTIPNFIRDSGLVFIDRYTGLEGTALPPPGPVIIPAPDSSNRGNLFWVGYGHHYNMESSSNTQEMVLYLSAEQAANVTVRINGTNYVRQYAVPANTVITSEPLPKTGMFDARLLIDGKSDRGIRIESDVAIVAYAHIYASTTSEATMLLPVSTYGYEYTALTTEQEYSTTSHSWFYVIAPNDSTKVEITPSNLTKNGSPAGVPFIVWLNQGEVYQALGAIQSGTTGYDLTGSTIKSLPNNQGRCLPIAVFSGSSRTNIDCVGYNASGSGDNIFEQNFPYTAWGKKYLVAPTSTETSASSLATNIYRVAVKNPATVVTRNGVPLTGLINNFFYEIESNTADVIAANQPIMVAQIMSSAGYCANTSGDGDPAMVYVSPVEQGIKRVGLYRNTQSAIDEQYVTLVIPNGGLASLRIDGSNVFDHTYAHNEPGYTVVVKRWAPATAAQVLVQSDSAFTLITYGIGSVESYAYNGGTLVKNLNAVPSFSNTLSTSGAASYTCVGAPMKIQIRLNIKPNALGWQLSQVPNISPNANVLQNNPTTSDSALVNGQWLYTYTLPGNYTFTQPGNYVLPIIIYDASIAGCSSSQEISLPITVQPKPRIDFATTQSVCLGATNTFNGTIISSNGSPITAYNWTFGDNTTGTGQSTTHTYATAGTFNATFATVAADGCIGDTTKPITVNPIPAVVLVKDTVTVCGNTGAVFSIQNPVSGVTYNWYSVATGGTPIATGTTFTTPSVSGTTTYYVQATGAGSCTSVRKPVVASVYAALATPMVAVGTVTPTSISFSWTAIPGALSYEVSTDNGTTWITPSSGSTGTNHIVSGLVPLTTVSLIVRANGSVSCQAAISAPVSATTISDQIYIPNAFTPNADGVNDVFLIYGFTIKSQRMMIFNQWGEKIFESNTLNTGWDGKYKGKVQPAGVYMYVFELVYIDGAKETKKGSLNLIR